MLPSMRVVVTGGAGYVGSVLVRHLLGDGHEVHVVDNLTFGGQSMMPLFINFGSMFTFDMEPKIVKTEQGGRRTAGPDIYIYIYK